MRPTRCLYDLFVNRFATKVDIPGARQLWAMIPNLSSAKQMTSSPVTLSQFQFGMWSKYVWKCQVHQFTNYSVFESGSEF